jgi:hypothetical protein
LNDCRSALDKGDETAPRVRFGIATLPGAHPIASCLIAACLIAACLIAACLVAACLVGSAAAQQPAATKRPTVALPALAAQGFEVKAAFASYLVLQKGKDVWLCYMLQTRSSCEPAE